MEVVAGLRRPDAGDVILSVIDVQRRPRHARRLIGFAPQNVGVYPRATGAENLRFFAGLAGLERRQALQRVVEVADVMGLAGLLEGAAR